MPQQLDQYGIGLGVIVALWIVRELFPLMKRRNGHKESSGDLPPDYWRMQFRDAVRAETEESLKEIKDLVIKCLERLPRPPK